MYETRACVLQFQQQIYGLGYCVKNLQKFTKKKNLQDFSIGNRYIYSGSQSQGQRGEWKVVRVMWDWHTNQVRLC